MKNQKKIFVAALVLAAFALASFLPKENALPLSPASTQMIADWERAKAFTKEYLDASTDASISFKPTPEMRTFGQQMLHLAEANYGLGASGIGKPNPVPFGSLEKSDKYKTKAELSKAVLDSYDFVIGGIKEMNDQQFAEMVKVFNAFDMTRAVALQKTFEHQTHHRGQATVYLRLAGIKPPEEKLF